MDGDIILQVWQYMASDDPAQSPLMFTPASALEWLPAFENLCGTGRRQLSERQRREFMKAAQVVGEKPWLLSEAQS